MIALPATREDLWEEAVLALAFVLCLDVADVKDMTDDGGDVTIQSKDAEVVIALVEEGLGAGPLVDGSELDPQQLTSLATLTDLLWSKSLSNGESA